VASEALAENDRLYTARQYLSSIGMVASLRVAEREQDATGCVVAIAGGRIADDLVDLGTFERPRDERRPHAPVERG